MSLTLSGVPTFVEVTEPQLDPGQTLTQAVIQAMNADVKFAAVAVEDFWGFYRDGETVALPISAADGYMYAREELMYTWEIFSTRPAGGALAGTTTPPTPAAASALGQILQMGFSVDQQLGTVACSVSYYVQGGAQTDTHDGILCVHTLARRGSTFPLPPLVAPTGA